MKRRKNNEDVYKRQVDTCRECKVELGIIMQHRFDKPIVLLKEAVAQGKLGKLLWGASRTIWYRDEEYFSNPWRGTWEFDGGGSLMNQSIHYIDLLIDIFGKVKSEMCIRDRKRTLYWMI